MPKQDLRDVATHFEFGRNWTEYARSIDEEKIEAAKQGLLRLIPADQLTGRTFLDIGCGSGIHALAAARLGVKKLCVLDIDPMSVAATKDTLTRFNVNIPWDSATKSVFDLAKRDLGTFDIVYSWGVLHHTGDMDAALRKAASLVAPGGLFAFGLYRRTRLDRFWIAEKRWYCQTSRRNQRAAQKTFDIAYRIASGLSGKKAHSDRGMDYWYDMHDWLGGYPYEAILAPEVEDLMNKIGFEKVTEIARPIELGLFGSGCDEYVYRRLDN